MDLQAIVFQTLVVRLLKMILYVLVYPDFRETDSQAEGNIETLMHHARKFARINTKEPEE